MEPFTADLQVTIISAHEKSLKTLVDPYRTRIKIKTTVLKGTLFLKIIREVLRSSHDLVIKNPESLDCWMDRLFGSADMHLLRKCPCTV